MALNKNYLRIMLTIFHSNHSCAHVHAATAADEEEEWTPLHYAAKSGQREAFRTLVEYDTTLLMVADGELINCVTQTQTQTQTQTYIIQI